jgi:hypothetical protein
MFLPHEVFFFDYARRPRNRIGLDFGMRGSRELTGH